MKIYFEDSMSIHDTASPYMSKVCAEFYKTKKKGWIK